MADEYKDSKSFERARGGGYGLDREFADRAAAKYDSELEATVRSWLEALSGESIGDDFEEGLRSGVILCKALHAIKPGLVKFRDSKMPFVRMENISSFLKGCRALGVPEHDLFGTVDLYEGKDLMQVLLCIQSLGRVAQRIEGYSGPVLGVRMSEKQERTFTEAQLNEARAAPSRINMGSSQAKGFSHK